MDVIIPAPLKRNDLIAIVPTARAIVAAELAEGIALAESWGLRVRLGSGVGRKHFQQAGTDAERAADLQAAIDDPEVRAIWCARGGYGTIRLMDKVDLGPLRRDAKWVVGFSDVTVLHNALHTMGIATLHAQMPFMIGSKTEACRTTLRSALFGTGSDILIDPAEVKSASSVRPGIARGVLVGGNLSMLCSMRGTTFDIDPAGKILFLEDLDELLYHVDRMVQNLKYGNWFRGLAGLVVGGMSDMRDKNPSDPFGSTAEAMLQEALAGTDHPFCTGFPAGHIDDNRALPLGMPVELEVSAQRIALRYPTGV
ncbi:MAG: LD-carboxypeptidase [Flavobacteriales bacterium]